jgi:hypothetical protein
MHIKDAKSMSVHNNKGFYEYRVVRDHDILVDMATEGAGKTLYLLYECHYGAEGKITDMCLINDMTAYSRADATDFLLRMSAATLKPVLDTDGNVVEDSLIDPGRAVIDILGARK